MIEFKKIREYPKNTLYNQLVDAYSCNDKFKKIYDKDWKEYDDFFYSNLEIADKYGFITVVDGIPVGHITWDPRNPEFVIIGHNCIISKFKGNGYGKIQLQEAVNRIKEYSVKKISVTTNKILFSAQKNYESVGFKKISERINKETPFSGNYIDYEMILN